MGFAELLAAGDVHARGILGRSVTYTPAAGAPVTVNGVFEAAYRKLELGQPGVSSTGPAVFLALSDLPDVPTAAARVTVGGVVYEPWAVEPDGLGGVLLLLHEVV